ncbi:hypothetical protein M011DRAFT_475932 [Sporormia fimetaria CBS 119925]|uniref:Uncharacterized protein n=1 Tax=Sporormia fimetaria CBS 119925 TaxID=1340428 RepID=A0A6A6VJ23_9PLEO|nr:hypothetical protein M011DRAFT_475932 [Sporormia fimetaria CBS 119925]
MPILPSHPKPFKAQEKLIEDTKAHGPLPPNYMMVVPVENGGKTSHNAYYIDRQQSLPKLKAHPLKADRSIVDDVPDRRKRAVGAFHPPFHYNAAMWKWTYYDTMQQAVCAALAASNVTHNGDPISTDGLDAAIETVKGADQFHRELFHPHDRDTVDFEGEAECAEALRTIFKTGLIIMCPRVTINGNDWNKMWKEGPHDAYLDARWSTGVQGDYFSVVVGCIIRGLLHGPNRSCAMVRALTQGPRVVEDDATAE